MANIVIPLILHVNILDFALILDHCGSQSENCVDCVFCQ
jgi:hypothetical protein